MRPTAPSATSRVARLRAASSVRDVLGQRYLGTERAAAGDHRPARHAGRGPGRLHGRPDDPRLRQRPERLGNTMNAGRIVVHGSAGDVVGHSMRGGQIWVRGNVGYRVGIHMKASGEDGPVIVVGGSAGDFLGEYMAGGVLIVLGLDGGAAGPPGGQLHRHRHARRRHLRARRRARLPHRRGGRRLRRSTRRDRALLRRCLEPYCAEFGLDLAALLAADFTRLDPPHLPPLPAPLRQQRRRALAARRPPQPLWPSAGRPPARTRGTRERLLRPRRRTPGRRPPSAGFQPSVPLAALTRRLP